MSNEASSAIPSRMAMSAVPAKKYVASPSENPTIVVPDKARIQYDPVELRQQLQETIKRLNDHLQQSAKNLVFSMDEQLNRFVITVRDAHSGEVVRQIPDEAVLKIAHNIEELKGILLNEKI